MKRTVIFARLGAILVALVMLFSFAACNAAMPNEGMAPEMNDSPSLENGPMYDASVNNKPLTGDEGGTAEGTQAMPPAEDKDDAELNPADPAESEGEQVESEAATQKPEDVTGTVGEEQTATEETQKTDPKTELLQGEFTSAQQNPFSTFSADVDTASYTYFRKLVNSGYSFENLRYSGSGFRIEEFINYFRYDVPQPEENELFGVKTELVPCPWNSENLLFRITLQAEDAKPSAGNNLVFLIDVSGSMSGNDKLPLLKKAFSYLVGNLTANDTVSIVTYSGKEAVVLDGCNGLESDRIMNAINSLKASGSTNGEAGLSEAYRIAEANFIEGGNNRIIMASDGDLNVGISSSEELTKYIEQKRDQGVYLSVLGFGTGNYRDANMEALADNGNGVYYYIDGESEAEKVFGTDLSGTLYTVANDVKLQVEFNTQRVEAYRLIGYENRVLDKEDFEDDTKDAGEVGASHQVTVVYEITPAEISGDIIDAPMMTLRIRYKKPGETLSRLNEYMISGVVNEPSEDMRFITAVIETAALLRNREYDGDITLSSIHLDLCELELEDTYKAEFKELIQALSPTK